MCNLSLNALVIIWPIFSDTLFASDIIVITLINIRAECKLIFRFTSIPIWFVFKVISVYAYGGWRHTERTMLSVPDRAAVVLMSLRRNYAGLFSTLLLPS